MPYGVLLGRRSTNRLGGARSSREARVMHAPPQKGHRGPRRPQRGRITSKLKRVGLQPDRPAAANPNTVMNLEMGWPALIRNTRNISDFQGWETHDVYQKAFDRLLRDLK